MTLWNVTLSWVWEPLTSPGVQEDKGGLCFTNVPMITYRHVLGLAAGLDPVGTAAVIGRGPHLHLSQHLAQ